MNRQTWMENAIDVMPVFLEFIRNNKNINGKVSKNIPYFYNEHKLEDLFEENEKIITDANEVPRRDGSGWNYNGHSTYDYFYALLDNNQLLVICIQGEIENYEFTDLWFHLYPNADKMSVYLLPGHDKKPYFNLFDENGNLVNSFPYERIHYHEDYAYGIKLKDLVFPVDRDTIEERFEVGKKTY